MNNNNIDTDNERMKLQRALAKNNAMHTMLTLVFDDRHVPTTTNSINDAIISFMTSFRSKTCNVYTNNSCKFDYVGVIGFGDAVHHRWHAHLITNLVSPFNGCYNDTYVKELERSWKKGPAFLENLYSSDLKRPLKANETLSANDKNDIAEFLYQNMLGAVIVNPNLRHYVYTSKHVCNEKVHMDKAFLYVTKGKYNLGSLPAIKSWESRITEEKTINSSLKKDYRYCNYDLTDNQINQLIKQGTLRIGASILDKNTGTFTKTYHINMNQLSSMATTFNIFNALIS